MKLFILILVLLVSCQLSVVNCFAQSKNDFSVSISPLLIEIEATTPSNPSSIISLQNNSESDSTFDIKLKEFSQDQLGTGQIRFSQANASLNKIIDKIKIYNNDLPVTKVKLIPFESKNLELKIDASDSIKNGDYYFAVEFTSESPENALKSTVSSQGGLSTLVILSIDNNTIPNGKIRDFKNPIMINQGPVEFKLLLENVGSHYSIPRGRIDIQDMFGKKVGAVNILPQYLLAESKRYLIDNDKKGVVSQSVVWPEKFLLGIYKATAVVKMAENSNSIYSTSYFISLPVLPIAIFTGLSFVIIGVVIRAKKKIRKQN